MATTKATAADAPPVVAAAEFTTIPFDGIPNTQAISEGYGANAKTAADIAALTPCTMNDFKANLAYKRAVRIGVVNTGTAEVPVFEDRYELIDVYVRVWNGLLQALVEFQNDVNSGNAFTPAVAPSTTLPPTTIPPTTV